MSAQQSPSSSPSPRSSTRSGPTLPLPTVEPPSHTTEDTSLSRFQILEWVNADVLGLSHDQGFEALHSIPSHVLALVLRGVLQECPSSIGLSQNELLLSLQQLQFPEATETARDRGNWWLASLPSEHAEVQNLKAVLNWIRRIQAHLESQGEKATSVLLSSSLNGSCSSGSSSGVEVPMVEAEEQQMAIDWCRGIDFVRVLHVWRWIYGLAREWEVRGAQLQLRIHSFLRGDEPAQGKHRIKAEEKREACPSSRTEGESPVEDDALVLLGKKRDRDDITTPLSSSPLASVAGKMEKEAGQAIDKEAPLTTATVDRSVPLISAARAAKAHLEQVQAEMTSSVAPHNAGEPASVIGSTATSWEVPVQAVNVTKKERVEGQCTCSEMVRQSLQVNLMSIDRLERARLEAIEACLNRDTAALLSALQSVLV